MLEEADHFCGVGAVVDPSSKQNVAPYIGTMLRRLEHRGSGACGVAYIDHDRGGELLHLHKEGRARHVLPELRAVTSSAIVHTLYRTNPHSKPHPYLAEWRDQRVAVAFNGNIPPTLREKQAQHYLASHGNACETRSDTELIGRLIAMHLHDTQGDMRRALQRLPEHLADGAYNIVCLRPTGEVDVFRDPHGVHPLVLGETKNGLHAVASEDQVLRRLWTQARSVDVSRIKPGMMVHLGPGVMEPEREQLFPSDAKLCSFELAYFADWQATLDGARITSVRRAFGQRLAKLDEQEIPSWSNPSVVPVPESARTAAEGYADEGHVRHIDVLLKRPDAARSFIAPEERERIIREKFEIDWSLLFGRDVILIDDSLVRGTTMKTLLDILHHPDSFYLKVKQLLTTYLPIFQRYGIRIHLRFAFPPIIAPCFYGIDFSKRKELLVPRFDHAAEPVGDVLSPETLQGISRFLGADSVKFLPISAVHEAAGMPADELCRACFTGSYPTEGGQHLYKEQQLLQVDTSRMAKEHP